MNPMIQLQQCLVECAMAGASLIGENVRLKKTIESLTPFAMRNPVFKKIQNDTKNLLTLPREQQGIQLLKLLALVNAVVVTMTQTNIEGTQPIKETEFFGTYVEIPHSHMEQLLYALTQKGAGRMEIVEELFQEHPEYFKDYRVQEALLQGLKDPYIAVVVCAVIVKLGENMLPILQDGFDYKGKRDMGYRAFCIAKITGNERFKQEVEEQGSKVVKDSMQEAERFKFIWKRMEWNI